MTRKLRSYQAITTKYLSATDKKDARVKAMAAAGSIIVPWDHSLNIEENHAAAASALAKKLDWAGKYYIGSLPDDAGYCFVCAAFDDETLAFFHSDEQRAA